MNEYIDIYWSKRIEKCKKNLEKNNFEVFVAQNPLEANAIIMQKILPKTTVNSVSWGDSISLHSTKILETLKENTKIKIIETFDKNIAREEIIQRRRQALLTDVFFTGSNAVTESGKLVNLDMVGNRIAGIIFGPKYVVIVVGRNKIVTNTEEAMKRVKNYAAPLNAIRHESLETPCVKTSYCVDCKSPNRICNTWSITEKAFPKNRIKVIIINQDLGL